ncbi:uncharacterized protein EDB91DRAFT_1123153 [Suillus paluster]|uniref:uncharacterized protein n=1 Tax=Suillus paluster TaxID=48578 RepID=UPI001B86DF55|nr:uncharacterized protein EDB91DRAFT_1123153 [Suillus paluster]KAG1744585.1 hypothetical protein EDB91DRAFT_1123153 [Suillus paluster]
MIQGRVWCSAGIAECRARIPSNFSNNESSSVMSFVIEGVLTNVKYSGYVLTLQNNEVTVAPPTTDKKNQKWRAPLNTETMEVGGPMEIVTEPREPNPYLGWNDRVNLPPKLKMVAAGTFDWQCGTLIEISKGSPLQITVNDSVGGNAKTYHLKVTKSDNVLPRYGVMFKEFKTGDPVIDEEKWTWEHASQMSLP